METIDIEYRFVLDNGQRANFRLQFAAESMELIVSNQSEPPDWTALDFEQCPHCPLSKSDSPHCPVSRGLVQIVDKFDQILSYENLKVEVIVDGRKTRQNTTAQKGLSSLMGLIIATSGCPHTTFFRAMARHHLPFATHEETLCRATAFYLLGQYLQKKAGEEVRFSLSGLNEIYQNIQKINTALARRLRAAAEADSTVNAIVILDFLAQTLPIAIDESLEEIRYVYKPYFDQLANN